MLETILAQFVLTIICVITSGFDEKKVQVNTTLFKERFVVKDKAEYDLVYNQREYKDFLEKKKPI
jgi:hypothetical protein